MDLSLQFGNFILTVFSLNNNYIIRIIIIPASPSRRRGASNGRPQGT